jgi:hypothetical protein
MILYGSLTQPGCVPGGRSRVCRKHAASCSAELMLLICVAGCAVGLWSIRWPSDGQSCQAVPVQAVPEALPAGRGGGDCGPAGRLAAADGQVQAFKAMACVHVLLTSCYGSIPCNRRLIFKTRCTAAALGWVNVVLCTYVLLL